MRALRLCQGGRAIQRSSQAMFHIFDCDGKSKFKYASFGEAQQTISRQASPPKEPSFPAVRGAALHLTTPIAKSLFESDSQLLFCKCEPNDVLFTPAAWLVLQSTSSGKATGVRRSVIAKNVDCCKDAARLLAEVKPLTGLPQPSLQFAIWFLPRLHRHSRWRRSKQLEGC